MRSNEKHCVCNVFATPHSKNPVKSSVPSSASDNLLYYSERDCSEEFLYTRATDQSLCWHKPLESCWKDSGKIVERPWQTVKIT